MTNGQLDGVLQHIRKLAADGAGATSDRALLERFVRQRDEAAFAALVQRHGPMVLGVCRRVLRHVHDAEDACQATFLVLARRAATIRNKDALGSWLHGVAYRASASLQRRIARRQAREGPAVEVAQPEPADVSWREVRGVLDEELRRLPERFQAPLLLCYLEGKTRDEAAQQLGWSLGTLRGRLERGRELLRSRLTRRGLTLSAALLAGLLSERAASAALPATLVVSIVRATTNPGPGAVSVRVAALLEEVSRAMFLTRLKVIAAVSLGASAVGLWVVLLASGVLAARQAEAPPGASGGEAAALPDGPAAGGGDAAAADDSPAAAHDASESRRHLRQLALAMNNYRDQMGHFPAPAIYADQVGGPGSNPGPPAGAGSGGGPFGAGEASSGGGGDRSGGGSAPTAPGGPAGAGVGAPPGPAAGPGGSGPAAPGPAGGEGSGGGGPPRGGMRPPGVPGMGMPPGFGGPGGKGGSGPPGAGRDRRALLSWRVALLPYLGEQDLFRQFHLEEPWDSPHNKPLLNKMPWVYAAPGVTTREPNGTFYQVFVGPHAAFEKHEVMGFANITDGTSNTLLIVEAASAVPWTKPEDLHFDEDEPLPELGGLYPGIFNAALADGTVHAFFQKADPDILRAAITRDLGEVVDLGRIEAPASRREAKLRELNERLQRDLEREKTRVQELRREKEALRGEDADPKVDSLEKDNVRLEVLLKQSRAEADRLQEEIRRLRQSREKRPGNRPEN
jgi:RNA polymerase sigma factor (sigma-70 family)